MTEIPLVIHEEHHEAFLIWHRALDRGWLRPQGNALIHVDHHDDFRPPLLRTPIREAVASPDLVERLTYNELKISSFILPALYLGLFESYHWLQTGAGQEGLRSGRYYLRTYGGQGKVFLMAEDKSAWQPPPTGQDRVVFRAESLTAKDRLEIEGPSVLDIDLDWFSCAATRPGPRSVEVTQAEFERFRTDRYHFLRLEANTRARREGGRYLIDFDFNTAERVTAASKVSTDTILARLDALAGFLEANRIRPNLINVARSLKSGYTPRDQGAFIERELVHRLESIYPLKKMPFEKMLGTLNPGSGP